ncbi:lysosomal dipeptide transporter MFSD1-like [Amphiura filiformis]|uniref:lysosomal dipeptide transporter MFSD1-like n=1 Tax=Amphiura filiformis TaxID=82378 RepID=UPI003B2135E7
MASFNDNEAGTDDENRPLLSERVEANKEDENSEDMNNEDIELTGCGATAACNPHRTLHRFLVLILICFLSFGSYFCYDNPSALQNQIKDAMEVDTSKFMLLYSLYSWPNVLLCFFGGFLLDRVFGIRLGTVIFSIFIVLGQCIFALGASLNSYNIMLAGRFVFGLGGENLAVAQNTYAVVWFKEKELNMVFGLQLSFSRVGSTLNMNIMKPIYDLTNDAFPPYQRLGIALWVGAGFTIFSLLCGVYLGYLDGRAAKILKREAGSTGEKIQLRDIKDFPLTLWLMFFICVAYYVAVFPFIGLGIIFFEDKFGFSPAEANAVNSLVYFISAGASPLFGFLVDRFGRNVYWLILGVILTLASHGLLAFTFLNPFVSMSLMGCAYSILACALWPIVAFIMPEHQLGTAYGFMQSIQNLGLAVVSQVAGLIADKYGYLMLEVFFMACLCVALICGVLLYLVDASRGGFLNLSTSQREKLKKEGEIQVQKPLSTPVKGGAGPSGAYIRPQSPFHLRNRYLSRLGAKLPDTYNVNTKALARHGVLQ